MNQTLRLQTVKIRKPRKCFGCQQKFEPGQEMVYLVSLFENEFGTSYWCKPCNAYMEKFADDFEDGIGEGDLRGEEHYEKFKTEYQQPTTP